MSEAKPPQQGNRPADLGREYQRAYKACLHCHQTKSKCEPAPDSPSCIKCLRERRQCEFTVERSSKKRKTGHRSSPNSELIPPASSETTSSSFRPASNNPQTTVHVVSRATIDHPAPRYDSDVVATVVSSSKDALGLLFKAAEQQETDSDEADEPNPTSARVHDYSTPRLTSNVYASTISPSSLSNPPNSIIELWNHHRFVRNGWFSAVEAVTYVDLFVRSLSNLSPISSSFRTDISDHRTLIFDQPLLCCTILMISSRYHVLPGAGAASRAELIHMRLWKYCEQLIARITFGQERYATTKLRTLGSIKALLLMTEWHPRSLHFPPENDGWNASLAPSVAENSEFEHLDSSHPSRWREEVFEPAKRSDRMSWMLLGHAITLAHELGVFDEPDPEDDGRRLCPDTRINTQRLLFLYANQLSLRIGCTSPLPQSLTLTLKTTMTGQANLAAYDRDVFISQSIDIMKLRRTTTEMFFPSRSATRQIMNSGKYMTLLEHFQPLLNQWYQRFKDTEFTTLPEASKQMLFIDYSYVRMYINSIAIQAVVERAKSKGTSALLGYEFVNRENWKEYAFIQEVVDGSRSILTTAVELAEADLLRYCPVRVFISITSASIFLLKAISLGTRQGELDKSLSTLEECIHALRYRTHDDMHLSSRYGMLLDRHVRKFKHNFRVQNEAAILPKVKADQHSFANNHGTVADSSLTPSELTTEMDDWLAQPFDPAFAPFDFDLSQAASGLEMNSLNFLWNLPS